MKSEKLAGEFRFEQDKTTSKKSILYQKHLKLGAKPHMAAFGGYLMPLWYSGISFEHEAVRSAAGIFDCTHMGVLQFEGTAAAAFLNCVTTNQINNLVAGAAQYSYVLDAAGNVLDDIIVYKMAADNFMVVVNAANEQKMKTYFKKVISGDAVIDVDEPERKLTYSGIFRDLKTEECGDDCRVDIAIQGPASENILFAAENDNSFRTAIEALKPFHFIETTVAGITCIVSRTGYTGAKTGYELFVNPAEAGKIWDIILTKGKSFGLKPCGLGARDSLRIEAGLPLYGHELAGEFDISPIEAGYGWAVKLEKDFFVGKRRMGKISNSYEMKVQRAEFCGERGIRPIRYKDAVLNKDGKCAGWVLSSAKAGQKQYALVYVDKNVLKENEQAGIYYLARNKMQVKKGRKGTVEKTELLMPDIKGSVVKRFARF